MHCRRWKLLLLVLSPWRRLRRIRNARTLRRGRRLSARKQRRRACPHAPTRAATAPVSLIVGRDPTEHDLSLVAHVWVQAQKASLFSPGTDPRPTGAGVFEASPAMSHSPPIPLAPPLAGCISRLRVREESLMALRLWQTPARETMKPSYLHQGGGTPPVPSHGHRASNNHSGGGAAAANPWSEQVSSSTGEKYWFNCLTGESTYGLFPYNPQFRNHARLISTYI